MTQMAKLFRALADPNRLRIVNILSEVSLCVGDLQSVLGLPQPFISRHLAYLRRAGLVRDHREGSRVYYSLAADSPAIQALRAFSREVSPSSEVFRADLKRMRSLEDSGRSKSLRFQIIPSPSKSARSPADDDLRGEDDDARAA